MRSVPISGVAAVVALSALLWPAGPVSAHHSRAGVYESPDKTITMPAVVAEWRWRNPHVFLVWDTKGPDGTVVQWVGELSSITTMMGEGMTRTTLKPGDQVTVTVVPARSGAPQGQLVKVVMADGKVPLDRTRGPIPD